MATLFAEAGGNFSALTLVAVGASGPAPASTPAYDALNTTRTRAFTSTVTANVTGVVLLLRLNVVGASPANPTVTVVLQEQTEPGVWTNRATASATVADIAITRVVNDLGIGNGDCGHLSTHYFEFSSPCAIDTAADKWRLSVSSTGTGNNACYWWRDGTAGNYCYFVVTDSSASWSASDTLVQKQATTILIDESVTFTNWFAGNSSSIGWNTDAASSYTLSGSRIYAGYRSKIEIGSDADRIPYASQAAISLTQYYTPAYSYNGATANSLILYGEKPTAWLTNLAAGAASGQKVIVTTEDMSASWLPGDQLAIGGGTGTSGTTVEYGVIDTIVGTTVTLTTNLSSYHCISGKVANRTRGQRCGISYTAPFVEARYIPTLTLSGVYVGSSIQIGGDSRFMEPTVALPLLVEDCYFNNVAGLVNSDLLTSARTGSVYRRLYIAGDSWTDYKFNLNYSQNAPVVDNVFVDGHSGGFFPCILSGYGGSFSNIEVAVYGASGTMQTLTANGASNSYTNVGLYTGGTSYYTLGIYSFYDTFTNLSIQGPSAAALYLGTTIGCQIIDSRIGDIVGVSTPIMVQSSSLADLQFRNTYFDASFLAVSGYSGADSKSSIRFDTYHRTANDHRVFLVYGNLQSTGDGLTDTTVHTAGTGKFALRFQPTSATHNLELTFPTPCGNILGQTMTLAVWVKINSATYYAGTHQKPRLTVRYDNATDVYAEAVESTDWQLLSVTFTPATAYGQLTVTVSGRTDATGSDAYFYVDDFSVLFPPGYKLDLGGLDLWAEALPITPPIATVLSANDVWTAATAGMTGDGTIGKLLADRIDAAISSRAAAGGAMVLTPAYDAAKTAAQPGDAMTLTPEYDAAKTAAQAGDAMTLAATQGAITWGQQKISASKAGEGALHITNSGTGGYGAYVVGTTADVVGDITGNVSGSVGSVTDVSGITDAVWDEAIADHLTAGTTGLALHTAGSAAGTGTMTFTYTLTSSVDGTAIEGAIVEVYSDSTMSSLVATGLTNSAGQVVFYLDAGTYYLKRIKPGWSFTNPDQETVA